MLASVTEVVSLTEPMTYLVELLREPQGSSRLHLPGAGIISVLYFEILIQSHHFSLPFPPSNPFMHPPLALFQIHGFLSH